MKSKFIQYAKAIAAVSSVIVLITLTPNSSNAQWSELGGTNSSTFFGQINSLTIDASGNIYAAGNFMNNNSKEYVAKWDGSSWNELGGANSSTFNGYIYSLTTDVNGYVYAAGFFSGTKGVRYVEKWNGSNWSELGGKNATFFSPIFSLATDANNNVYAACTYTNTATSGDGYVSKYSGGWLDLGSTISSSPFNGTIQSITIDASRNVFAAGYFTNGSGKYYVAKWNGSSWVELGGTNSSTFNKAIYSLTTDASGNVYAAGNFTNSSGKYYVAEWNGSSWVELGGTNSSTFNNAIECLSKDVSGNLYAAGAFKNSRSKNYVAKWNGSSWAELGGTNSSTFNNTIFSLATDASMNVYAAGNFTNSGGSYYVAKYNASGLPIRLAGINAVQVGKTIQTNWHTSTELNTSHFTIQRSTDGSSFTDIGTVKAVGSGANGYSFTDIHPTDGINYYRLKSVDKDGSSTYSKVVSVAITNYELPITVYPNPSKSKVTVMGNHIVSVQVVDNMGRVIKTQVLKDATNPTLSVGSLPVGVFHLRVQTTDGKVSGVGFVKE